MSAIVIVGGGHAGGQAAAALRQGGHDGDLMIVGQEAHPPYQRPPLSKGYLSGKDHREHLYLRPAEYYRARDIELRQQVSVTGIDPAARQIIADGRERIRYQQLLIATGGRPRMLAVPGSDLEQIFYLRTIADADRIRKAMPRARRLCIVGGGYIGLEVAAVAVAAGLKVTVLECEDRLLKRVATPQLAEFYRELHRSRGVDVQTDRTVTGFAGAADVEAVCCGEQRVPADLVVIGIGILPNVELAERAGLACDNGIMVDERCRTSHPDIYAAGDCTNHPNPVLGRRLRLESVPNAMDQARVAASNMLGGDKTHAAVPWFWSDQYEYKLQMVGFAADGEEHITRGDPAAGRFAVFHLRQGHLVAVDAINCPKEFMLARKLFGRRVDAAKLADPHCELKSLLG